MPNPVSGATSSTLRLQEQAEVRRFGTDTLYLKSLQIICEIGIRIREGVVHGEINVATTTFGDS